MLATSIDAPVRHECQQNGVMIVRSEGGVAVGCNPDLASQPQALMIEVEHGGRQLKVDFVNSHGPPWRDYFRGIDNLQVGIRVKSADRVLAELKAPGAPLPFMVLQGEQQHVTESYVSIPPALTITDEEGAVWTLGFKTAAKDQSPGGEFAFNVLRNGIDMGEIASRIERRKKIRIFTKEGWKVWCGDHFF